MNSVVGILTAPRVPQTLERSLNSFWEAGWDHSWLFAEPGSKLPAHSERLTIVRRAETLGEWQNWVLTLEELYLRHPGADYYLMVEDDVLFWNKEPSLKQYLEDTLNLNPNIGFLSLYCCRINQPQEMGWSPIPTDRGLIGSLAMAFSRESVKAFLSDKIVRTHHEEFGSYWGSRLVDTVLGDWAKRSGRGALLHHPSLVKHIGTTSTVWEDAKSDDPIRQAAICLHDHDEGPKLWKQFAAESSQCRERQLQSSPKISCFMVAGPKLSSIEASLQSFLKQTHPNVELLIVCNSQTKRDLCQKYHDEYPRKIQFIGGTDTQGALLNQAIERSTGKIFCFWDENEIHFPERLLVQWEKMKRKGAIASYLTGYYSEKPLNFDPNQKIENLPIGLMIWKSFLPQYSHLNDYYTTENINILSRLIHSHAPLERIEKSDLTFTYSPLLKPVRSPQKDNSILLTNSF